MSSFQLHCPESYQSLNHPRKHFLVAIGEIVEPMSDYFLQCPGCGNVYKLVAAKPGKDKTFDGKEVAYVMYILKVE